MSDEKPKRQTMDEEEKIRFTCLLVREICAGMDYPCSSTVTALSLVRRASDYLKVTISVDIFAQACVLLAGKIEDNNPNIRSIAKICAQIKSARLNKIEFGNDKVVNEVKKAEMFILASIGFIVTDRELLNAHRYLIWITESVVQKSHQTEILKSAWGHVNDSMLLECYFKDAINVACASIALGAKEFDIELPIIPIPWYEVIGGNLQMIEQIAWDLYELQNNWEPPSWPSNS